MPQPRKTNSEIEIKLPVTDLRATIRAMRALGAVSQGRTFESNTLYDTPHSDLRNRGRLLRVRIESAAPATARIHSISVRRVVLTSKAPSRQHNATRKNRRYKERAEREEVAPHDARNWPATLAALGFQPAFRYEKYRSTFNLHGLHLDLDETPVGTFLELEGRPAAIDRVARALGYTPGQYIRATYWDVYAADCRRRGRPIENMVFPAK
ncbi:MAG: class IV adenylate cyclase [Candidatus Acidiferrales bacterium]